MASLHVPSLLKETAANYTRHKSAWLAAALAYFTIFAIAPLIIVLVEIGGIVLGQHQGIRHEIFGYMAQTTGPAGADAVRGIVDTTLRQPRQGIIAQVVGWAVFILAAVGLFTSLQDALNTIWDVTPKKAGGIMGFVKNRLLSFGLILAVAFLLLVSLVINTALTGFTAKLTSVFAGLPVLMKTIDFIISFGVVTLMFATLYRFLPDVRIEWRDVWRGAAVTALIFVVGQFILGWYLGRASVASAYGAFGSLIIFLLWTNYSAQIFLFGAEFTHVFARRHGSHAQGDASAIRGTTPSPLNVNVAR